MPGFTVASVPRVYFYGEGAFFSGGVRDAWARGLDLPGLQELFVIHEALHLFGIVGPDHNGDAKRSNSEREQRRFRGDSKEMFLMIRPLAIRWCLFALAAGRLVFGNALTCVALDPAGVPIPAEFTVAEIGGGVARSSASLKAGASGTVTFRELPNGTYRLAASLAGFANVTISPLRIGPDGNVNRVRVELPFGNVIRLRTGSSSIVSGVVLEGPESAVRARVCFRTTSGNESERCRRIVSDCIALRSERGAIWRESVVGAN